MGETERVDMPRLPSPSALQSKRLTADHIVPASKGGRRLAVLCVSCNSKKRAKLPDQPVSDTLAVQQPSLVGTPAQKMMQALAPVSSTEIWRVPESRSTDPAWIPLPMTWG